MMGLKKERGGYEVPKPQKITNARQSMFLTALVSDPFNGK